jgi:hypothetical protein
MPKPLALVLIAIALIALAVFGLNLSDSLHACSRQHWIGCDWGSVQHLGIWLIPVGVVVIILVGRLLFRGGSK